MTLHLHKIGVLLDLHSAGAARPSYTKALQQLLPMPHSQGDPVAVINASLLGPPRYSEDPLITARKRFGDWYKSQQVTVRIAEGHDVMATQLGAVLCFLGVAEDAQHQTPDIAWAHATLSGIFHELRKLPPGIPQHFICDDYATAMALACAWGGVPGISPEPIFNEIDLPEPFAAELWVLHTQSPGIRALLLEELYAATRAPLPSEHVLLALSTLATPERRDILEILLAAVPRIGSIQAFACVTETLIRCGHTEAVQYLRGLLHHPDPAVRERALDICQKYPVACDHVFDTLVAMTQPAHEPHPTLRRAAFENIATTERAHDLSWVRTLFMQDPGESVRYTDVALARSIEMLFEKKHLDPSAQFRLEYTQTGPLHLRGLLGLLKLGDFHMWESIARDPEVLWDHPDLQAAITLYTVYFVGIAGYIAEISNQAQDLALQPVIPHAKAYLEWAAHPARDFVVQAAALQALTELVPSRIDYVQETLARWYDELRALPTSSEGHEILLATTLGEICGSIVCLEDPEDWKPFAQLLANLARHTQHERIRERCAWLYWQTAPEAKKELWHRALAAYLDSRSSEWALGRLGKGPQPTLTPDRMPMIIAALWGKTRFALRDTLHHLAGDPTIDFITRIIALRYLETDPVAAKLL